MAFTDGEILFVLNSFLLVGGESPVAVVTVPMCNKFVGRQKFVQSTSVIARIGTPVVTAPTRKKYLWTAKFCSSYIIFCAWAGIAPWLWVLSLRVYFLCRNSHVLLERKRM